MKPHHIAAHTRGARSLRQRAVAMILVVFMVAMAPMALRHRQAMLQRMHGVLEHDVVVLRTRTQLDARDVDWQQAESYKASMPRDSTYQRMTPAQLAKVLPILVLSMSRSKDRRRSIALEMKAAGVKEYKFVDAVDGLHDKLDPREVRRYIGKARYRLWKRRQEYQLAKVAIDITHYRVLEDVLKNNRTVLVLEDDAELKSKSFHRDLLAGMKQLPQDWDVLYLYSCFEKQGATVGEGVRVLREGLCTLGYVATPAFAATVLQTVKAEARWGYGNNVDHIYKNLMTSQSVQAYICNPELAHIKGGIPSTVDYDKKHENVSEKEKQFIDRRLG